MTTMKLQKLVYYAQAWSLVWDERPLFRSNIEAWANGPVVPVLFDAHRGQYTVSASDITRGDVRALTRSERDTVDAIIKKYGNKSGSWLSALTHSEPPWRDARRGLGKTERGNSVIPHGAMADYYGNL